MARSDYIYLVMAGARRDRPVFACTVKHELRSWLLRQTRDDLSVSRLRDGQEDLGVIMDINDIKAGRRSGVE